MIQKADERYRSQMPPICKRRNIKANMYDGAYMKLKSKECIQHRFKRDVSADAQIRNAAIAVGAEEMYDAGSMVYTVNHMQSAPPWE